MAEQITKNQCPKCGSKKHKVLRAKICICENCQTEYTLSEDVNNVMPTKNTKTLKSIFSIIITIIAFNII